MAFNLDDYEPVADRIERFWKDHQWGSILTELIHRDDQRFVVKAVVYRSTLEESDIRLPSATGYAEEIIGSTNVNRTSALENCETSAIGRALANLGYAVKNRASREEMEKVQATPRPRSGMKRTPRGDGEILSPPVVTITEVPQSHTNGSVSRLTPEQALQVTKLKTDLLGRVNGDKAEAARYWTGTLESFGLDPKESLPPDMIPAIEHAIKGLAI